MSDQTDRQALEAFAADKRLRQLERMISEFNIFEALGIVRQERRHSDFLAFLLHPSENHGLGDRFLKRFLVSILLTTIDRPLSPIEVDAADFSDATVERELLNIDILIRDDNHQILCVVENKVDSSEHSNQLERYQSRMFDRYPAYRKIYVLLSPDGISPEAGDSPYIPVSYGQLLDATDEFLDEHRSTLGPTVAALIEHYATMLRRHIVADSDVLQLARQLYVAHKRAIDLVIESRPDIREQLVGRLEEMLASENLELEVFQAKRTEIRFRPREWKDVPELNKGTGWADAQGCTLAFECIVSVTSIILKLELGKVDPADSSLRNAIYEAARSDGELFKGINPKLTKMWTQLYGRTLLSRMDRDQIEPSELELEKLQKNWDVFAQGDLPLLRQRIASIFQSPS